jgi:DNA polymerase III alpha subunit (gram-positive type)
MNSIGLKILGFDFQIDKDRQDIEIYKIKQNDLLKNELIIKPSDNTLQRAKNINKINESKDDILKIDELSSDINKAFVIGEVFNNELRTFKTNNKKFYISICDHTGAIIISAFPSITPYKNYYLPENYLASFKVGD